MTSELIDVADCAYPFDYRDLPAAVAVVLGYVGAPNGTPHVWTQAEVDAVRATGRAWAPIFTPAAASLNAQLGLQAANEMIAALGRYRGLSGCPVFLDVEQYVWAADPPGAWSAVAAWRHTMTTAGHRQAWAYLPGYVHAHWAADWTGTRPKALPAELVGWQYAGTVHADEYDLSVFRPGVFAGWADPKGATVAQLDADDRKFIVDQLQLVQGNVFDKLRGMYGDSWQGHPHPAALVHLHAAVLDLTAQGKAGAGTGPGVADLARQLAADLGPALAGQLAAELARRLQS